MSKNNDETRKVVKQDDEIKDTEKEKDAEGETVDDKKPEPPKDDAKKDEKDDEKKEFFLIRGFKAVGRGVKKVGDAWCRFAQKHPYVATGLAAGAGVAAKVGYDKIVDHFCGGESSEVSTNAEVPQLPEADDPIEIDFDPEPELEMDTIELPNVGNDE